MAKMTNVGGNRPHDSNYRGSVNCGVEYYAGNFWWILGVALIATGIFRFCGLYRVLGINTCKIKS